MKFGEPANVLFQDRGGSEVAKLDYARAKADPLLATRSGAQGRRMMSVVKTAVPVTTAAGLDCRNLRIGEVVVHRIFARSSDKTVKPPRLSNALIKLPAEGKDAIQERVTAALGSKSHGIEVSIERAGEDDFFQLAADVLHGSKPEFIAISRTMAEMLAKAQGSTTAPTGMLMVVRGRIGSQSQRCVVVLKADVHDGFGASESDTEVEVEYLESLLLTPTQKFFKVALLLEVNSGSRQELGSYELSDYRAFLFDHLITAVETRSAAAYFYDVFLGMGIAKSSKKLTAEFYEKTLTFIQSAPITKEMKYELREALRVEMRNESTVISSSEFAKKNFPTELRKPYQTFLIEEGFPHGAVSKDVAYVRSRLRRPRKLNFESGVRVFIPADAAPEALEIVSTDDASTVVRIRGNFTEAV